MPESSQLAIDPVQGGGRPGIPRLAGQHNLYLKQQLESLGLLVRYQSEMVAHSRNLSPEQVEILVAFLGGD
jgi:cytochrome c553